MRKALYIAVFIMMGAVAFAQQLPHYTQYIINDFPMNPAIAGSKDYFDAKSNHRYQWAGITDAPRTYIISLHGPWKDSNVGLGGTLFTDITGPTRRTGLQLAYSYHLQVADNTKLSFGITGGLLQFAVDASKITLKEQGDKAFDQGLMKAVVPDAGAGLYLYSDKYFISLSAPQLIQSKLKFFDASTNSLSRMVNHYFIFGGYTFDLSEDFSLQPSAMFKYVSPAPPQAEIMLRPIYQDMLWVGASYRTAIAPFMADAVGASIGYTYQENLTFGYSYDFTLSNLRNYSYGTHEIMLGVKFRDRTKPKSTQVSIE